MTERTMENEKLLTLLKQARTALKVGQSNIAISRIRTAIDILEPEKRREPPPKIIDEQSEPPIVHVGRDGQPHYGPRAACTICFMWDQIASNERNAADAPPTNG